MMPYSHKSDLTNRRIAGALIAAKSFFGVAHVIVEDPQEIVGSEGVMIVEVFISQGDPVNPLTDHRKDGMHGLPGVTSVLDAGGQGFRQTKVSICFPEEKPASVGSYRPPLEVADQSSVKNSGELQLLGSTMCHEVGLLSVYSTDGTH